MDGRLIYHFGRSRCDGDRHLIHLLGGKGAGLAEMCKIGVSVPPGFTISTKACSNYYEVGELTSDIKAEIDAALEVLSKETGLVFGDIERPLLVSVRSGSVQSMPGMLDTILNVGINDEIAEKLQHSMGKRFTYESYGRLIRMYATTVLHLDDHLFQDLMDEKRKNLSLMHDEDITDQDAILELVSEFKEVLISKAGKEFPQDVKAQLYGAIGAVFRSWTNERAVAYRNMYNIPASTGTAVNVQSMVFGNINQNSATGVIFTRNPSTGAKELFGEFLLNAQGEDVVSGQRDPHPVRLLKEAMPNVYAELVEVCTTLERHNRDMQDIEFTVQDGKLWILQTRAGKRSAQAAIHIAVSMAEEGLISKKEAIMRIDQNTITGLLHPILDEKCDNAIFGRGLPASPGAVSGCVAFNLVDAGELKSQGKSVILVRTETSPEDIGGMIIADGVLTLRGGMTSHAAVVARGMGKPCVCGATGLFIDKGESFFANQSGDRVNKAESITINGSTGEIMLGEVRTLIPELSETFHVLMSWIDEVRVIGVMANADTPEDVKNSLLFGADGVGLCRTEHMFFSDDRVFLVREMILASDTQERAKALQRLEVVQKDDFKKMFCALEGKPITIRLLDPPLHEFLPTSDEAFECMAKNMGKSLEHIKYRVAALTEKNPMLGHRGCRVGVSNPEIYEMQIKAIFMAARELYEESNMVVVPEIMVPFVIDEREIMLIGELVKNIAQQFGDAPYKIGAMIELPRAALLADRLAKHVQFFSFGTNDLTQTTLGLSRDDSPKFMEHYINSGVFDFDPFAVLDVEGVGKLIRIAMGLIREVDKEGTSIKTGICGEHGSTEEAMRLAYETGITYVSCSPYKVPVAKLLSAKCAISNSDYRDVRH
ncbi:pyruvate, phosphate dikinase [Anaplasma bovis]|uniref:pyruvate, phosphate dikinase n=1 Tax=Anaplasma bovis TaxID=186733 RepID=UPI002FEEE65F